MIFTLLIVLAIILAIFWPEKEVFGNFLSTEIEKVEKYADQSTVLNDQVSKSTVGWHLDHVLLVIGSIYKQLESSDSSKYQRKFNKIRTLVFTLNGIPRGRGKSPDRVYAKEDVSKEEIIDRLKEVKATLTKFDSLPNGVYFDHPYFGMLTRAETKKFVKIHTNHHLKIVKDILK